MSVGIGTRAEDLRRDAYLRGGASLIMWAFALAAFLLGLIHVRNLVGASVSVVFLVLLGFPTVAIAGRVHGGRAYAWFVRAVGLGEVIGFTGAIYSLGGIEASYLLAVYVTYVSYMGAVEHRESPYLSAALCAFLFGIMVTLQDLGVLPSMRAYAGFSLPVPNQIMIAGAVSMLLFVTAYISASASGAIRRMRRQLSEQNLLLERRVEERTQALTREIEEHKRAQEQIAASLRDKEVLIKEVHHRVKNNLQVVSSLLNLQASFVQNPKTREMFNESEARVRSMALIHEMLYQGKGLERVEVGRYLAGLLSALSRSYGVTPEVIGFAVDAEGITLSIEKAIPCGLIITELVSNALKHAFPGGRKGTITISVRAEPSAVKGDRDVNPIRLNVKDDGVGLPGDLDLRHTETLGMQLVNTLAAQLGGSIEVTSQQGTSVTVLFAAGPEPTSS